MRLQHLEDDELCEGLEAGDQPILLQHLRQHAEHQGARRAHIVAEILDQQPEDVPEGKLYRRGLHFKFAVQAANGTLITSPICLLKESLDPILRSRSLLSS